ncbi:GbsR/MarR family transcriptional regulator [Demequina sp. NBRC 110056]|uniref:GbsR/MarR family transcriptional regulator n=1 Tax=Demequina sp. NBRC 110056 TaxID=1570345 RepID=UPI0009FD8A43|nr:MarR family transcriptional regulator [Demequina sp. NBRC 110056]
MTDDDTARSADARAGYAAQVSQYWETGGLTRAAGSILGHLMVCEPAAQTQATLASALHLSAGSVSTQLRTLTAVGMVERVRPPGERAYHYQLPQDMWVRILGTEDQRIAGLRALADAGMAALPATRPDRITSLDQMVRFFEGEWPRIAARLDEFLRKEGT